MKKAIFAGSFDPPSLGHLSIIQRAHSICEKLYVVVSQNETSLKKPLFSAKQKNSFLKKATQKLDYVEIITHSGLLIELAKELKVDFLIRGLRSFTDFDYEWRMAFLNYQMSGLETVFLMAEENLLHLSASLIREFLSVCETFPRLISVSTKKEILKKMLP
jgi:pantetheine-phosphate adenylyltransferase